MKQLLSMGLVAVVAFSAGLIMRGPSPLAADSSLVASKDGRSFMLEDLNIFWLKNLGSDGVSMFLENAAIYEEGLKRGLKPTEAEISDYIQTAMGQSIYQQFTQLYSERAVRLLVEETLVNRKYDKYLHDKIRKEQDVTVSEAEANKYFLSHIGQYHLPEGAYLSLITVETRPKAEAVLKRLKAGEDFNAVAGEVNMDPVLRAANGALGLFRPGDGTLPKELADTGMGLKPHQFSGIVQGQYCHIVYCSERAPEVSPTFNDVKDGLMQDLLEQKIGPYYDQAITDLLHRELPRFEIQASLFRPDDKPAKTAKPGQPATASAPAPAPKPAAPPAAPAKPTKPKTGKGQ